MFVNHRPVKYIVSVVMRHRSASMSTRRFGRRDNLATQLAYLSVESVVCSDLE
jgi:hypothetical protein